MNRNEFINFCINNIVTVFIIYTIVLALLGWYIKRQVSKIKSKFDEFSIAIGTTYKYHCEEMKGLENGIYSMANKQEKITKEMNRILFVLNSYKGKELNTKNNELLSRQIVQELNKNNKVQNNISAKKPKDPEISLNVKTNIKKNTSKMIFLNSKKSNNSNNSNEKKQINIETVINDHLKETLINDNLEKNQNTSITYHSSIERSFDNEKVNLTDKKDNKNTNDCVFVEKIGSNKNVSKLEKAIDYLVGKTQKQQPKINQNYNNSQQNKNPQKNIWPIDKELTLGDIVGRIND